MGGGQHEQGGHHAHDGAHADKDLGGALVALFPQVEGSHGDAHKGAQDQQGDDGVEEALQGGVIERGGEEVGEHGLAAVVGIDHLVARGVCIQELAMMIHSELSMEQTTPARS